MWTAVIKRTHILSSEEKKSELWDVNSKLQKKQHRIVRKKWAITIFIFIPWHKQQQIGLWDVNSEFGEKGSELWNVNVELWDVNSEVAVTASIEKWPGHVSERFV